MRQFISEYYGDSTRWFVGTVIDGSPPFGLEGRVKVRIHGIHSDNVNDIPQADLPWAQVMMPGNMFGVSGLGGNCQLSPGALVIGLFLDGKMSQEPFILGSIPKVEYPTFVQANASGTLNGFGLFRSVYDIRMRNSLGITLEQSDRDFNSESLARKREVAVKFMIDSGYNDIVAASIVGNLEMVSGLDSTFNDGAVIGIAAWEINSTRWKQYLQYTGRYFIDSGVDNFEVQLSFVLHELQTTRTLASSKLIKSNSIKKQFDGNKVEFLKETSAPEVFRKYYFSQFTRDNYTSQARAESNSETAYNTIWS